MELFFQRVGKICIDMILIDDVVPLPLILGVVEFLFSYVFLEDNVRETTSSVWLALVPQEFISLLEETVCVTCQHITEIRLHIHVKKRFLILMLQMEQLKAELEQLSSLHD